jgi:hypothetical protein
MSNLINKPQANQPFTSGDVDSNPHLIMEGGDSLPVDYQNLAATKECEIKQGYLALVYKIKNSEDPTQFPSLFAKSTFAVLNKNSLSFFDKEHVNSLIKILDIVHL